MCLFMYTFKTYFSIRVSMYTLETYLRIHTYESETYPCIHLRRIDVYICKRYTRIDMYIRDVSMYTYKDVTM